MRMLLLAIGMFSALAATAHAGDDGSPIAGKLPDNDKSQVSYLFMLKKNGIALRIEPDQFCQDLVTAMLRREATGKIVPAGRKVFGNRLILNWTRMAKSGCRNWNG